MHLLSLQRRAAIRLIRASRGSANRRGKRSPAESDASFPAEPTSIAVTNLSADKIYSNATDAPRGLAHAIAQPAIRQIVI